MRIGLNNPQDVIALLIRRKWWVIFPFLALSSAMAILVHFLPHTYISETLVLVRPRDVPSDFVRDLISGSAEERLRVIQQQILSRTNLLQIMREFGDQLPELRRLNIDDQVNKLRSQINIFFEINKGPNGNLPVSYFRISYQNQNPELAQKITQKLTTLFIEQDSKQRETQVFGTTEFFGTELQKVQQELEDSDGKLKQTKVAKMFELPDQRDSNLRTLDRLTAEKRTITESLDRMANSRLNLERELAETPAELVKTGPPVPVGRNARETKKLRQQQADYEEYAKAKAAYKELSTRYKESHPDVQAAKIYMERLQHRLAPEVLAAYENEKDDDDSASANEIAEPNPIYKKLVAQLEDLNTEIKFRERDKAFVENEIAKFSRRIESTPQVEQEVSDILRVRDDQKKVYDNLKGKLSEAQLSESLESRQKGSQFQIIDPANYPIVPAKPNKQAVLMAGIVVSLLIALALAIAVDIARQKVWSQSQAETFWGAPVLIEIPEIVTDADLAAAGKKKRTFAAFSAAGVLVYAVFLYGVYLKHNFFLQQLDPVIQKLIYK